MVRSEGWACLKRYLRQGGETHRNALRSRKAAIETIRYAQGALDAQDVILEQLTPQFIRECRKSLAEAIATQQELIQQDTEKI